MLYFCQQLWLLFKVLGFSKSDSLENKGNHLTDCCCCCCSVMSNSLPSMDCNTPDSPVLHYLPEFAQTHVHWVGDAIQPSHPLLSPSPPALYLSQHQGLFPVSWLFTSGGQSIGVSVLASILPMSSQGWFPLRLTAFISLWPKGLSRIFSSTTVQKNQFFSVQPSLWFNSHTIHDYWIHRSFDYTYLCGQNDVSVF